ncbi:MAG TPA: hypothetical protein VGB93_14600, partial [Methylovirgula sp.]
SLLTLTVCLVAVTASAEEKFVPLFNGTNLDGWEGDPELWRVDGGAIVGSTENKESKAWTRSGFARCSRIARCAS